MLLTRTSLASIIIKSIAETFFWEKAIRTRAISCDKGAGALQAVAKYTTPYMSTVMVRGQRKAIKFEGNDMEGKLYISQLYYGYWVLINIFNIMIAVYLHGISRVPNVGQGSSRCSLIESRTTSV